MIHVLISSLTKNEKGYFIKKLSNNESIYVDLFKEIDKQKNYNESLLKKKYVGTYVGNNFSFAKNYLYHAILKNLISYNSSKKDTYYYLTCIKILYEKGLYYNCSKMLKTAYQREVKVGNYLAILHIIKYTKLLLYSDLHSDFNLLNIISQEEKVLKKQQIVSKFQLLLMEVKNVKIKKGFYKESESLQIINNARNHIFLQSDSYIIDKHCEKMYHEILFMCGIILSDYELTHKHIEPLQSMIEQQAYDEYFNSYQKLEIFKQIIQYQLYNKNLESVALSTQKLKMVLNEAVDMNRLELVAAYSYIYTIEIDVLLRRNRLEEALVVEEEIDAFVSENKSLIQKRVLVILKANTLTLQFMLGDYKNALIVLNELTVTYKNELRKDIRISMMLIEVVIFYELKNMELFESRLISFNYHLKQKKTSEPVWDIYADFFNKILQGNSFSKQLSSFNEKINIHKSSSLAVGLEFLTNWINSKV